MNTQNTGPSERFQRLWKMLESDPQNSLLLADASEAALHAGAFPQAEQAIDRGMALEGATAAWLFRKSNLRLAQRRLDEAGALLSELKQVLPQEPSVDHNLAYIALLQGRYDDCEQLVDRWMQADASSNASIGAAQALWLRAQHHAGRLDKAWAWIEGQGAAIAPMAAGVASLIAVDLDHLEAARILAGTALRADPSQPEALVARACAGLAARNPTDARPFAQRATELHPHLTRAWSTLGYIDLLQAAPAPAQAHFARALQLSPQDMGSLMGQGWACVLAKDLRGAKAAFGSAVQLDPEYVDAHAALAIVAALGGEAQAARHEAQRANELQGDGPVAKFAESMASGGAQDPQRLQALTQELLADTVLARKAPSRKR